MNSCGNTSELDCKIGEIRLTKHDFFSLNGFVLTRRNFSVLKSSRSDEVFEVDSSNLCPRRRTGSAGFRLCWEDKGAATNCLGTRKREKWSPWSNIYWWRRDGYAWLAWKKTRRWHIVFLQDFLRRKESNESTWARDTVGPAASSLIERKKKQREKDSWFSPVKG